MWWSRPRLLLTSSTKAILWIFSRRRYGEFPSSILLLWSIVLLKMHWGQIPEPEHLQFCTLQSCLWAISSLGQPTTMPTLLQDLFKEDICRVLPLVSLAIIRYARHMQNQTGVDALWDFLNMQTTYGCYIWNIFSGRKFGTIKPSKIARRISSITNSPGFVALVVVLYEV